MTSASETPLAPPGFSAVARLSVALLFFSVPHILEDFMLQEPLKRGVPVAMISLVVSLLLATQAQALLWVGQQRRAGMLVHAVLGPVWALAAGSAQLPELFAAAPYRSGFMSATWVVGIITIGVGLGVVSARAWWRSRSN